MKLPLMLSASLLALCAACSSAKAGVTDFTYTGGFQSFTAPSTGLYDILAYGAQGGSSSRSAGGNGAEIGGNLMLTANEVLQIAVGGMGANNHGAGGGGGSFVVGPNSTPLVIAGGGGGASGAKPGGEGLITRSGAAGTHSGGAGGTNGSGGHGGYGYSGGNGGGFKGSGNGGFGGNGFGYPLLMGGYGYTRGGFGGGGGGGGYGSGGGGGGGGYSGGGGGGGYGSFGAGGGGGSFLSGSAINDVLLAGVNSGDGLVTITAPSSLPPAIPAPEPGSLLVLATGLLGLAAAKRRQG